MRRYHITLGALTTANGQVVSASGRGSIDGKQAVLEGDKIMCRACKSTGYVLCVGPRIPETWDGKQVALQGDLCICKCSSPPQLIANQSLSYQTIEGDGMGAAPNWSAANSGFDISGDEISETQDLEQFFVFVDAVTGQPINTIIYKIVDGASILADKAGLTVGETIRFSMKQHPSELKLVAWVKEK